MAKKNKAFSIAKTALQSCYEKKGIVAGRTHYNYYWARDSLYASWGALEIGDYEIVKQNLELFLRNSKDNGQVPIRVGASNLAQTLSLAGIRFRNKNVAVYRQDKGFNPAMDPNTLLLITLDRYLEITKDKKFAGKYLQKIHMIIDWLEIREKEGLLKGGKYSTWQDIVKKNGFCLYTNVLHYQALVSVSSILKKLNVENEFLEKARIVKQKINQSFWDKNLGHYIDCYNKDKKSKVFSSDGNFFAVVFGVADKNKSDSILKKADELRISKDVPSLTNVPKYGFRDVYSALYLVGMQDYNNGTYWSWLGCLHSMALSKAGKKKEAKKVLEKLGKLFVKNNEVYEIYEKNGKPMKRLFYKSEHPFAWSAGLYIIAKKMLQ